MLRGKAEARTPDAAEAELLAIDERYIRRDEVRALVEQMADLEVSMTMHFDKLNTLAARLRKRDQRAAAGGDGAETPAEGSHVDPAASRVAQKTELRRTILHMRNHGG